MQKLAVMYVLFGSNSTCMFVRLVIVLVDDRLACVQTLSYEPQVLIEALRHLNDVLKSLESVNHFLDAPGSSVLLQELVNAPPLDDITISGHTMPLLNGLSAVHSCISVFAHICKVGQVHILTTMLSNIAHASS